MSDRCEPPPELRGVNGWHWVCAQAGGEFIAEWRVADRAGLEPLWRIPLVGGTATPAWAGERLRWRYLSPVATPAEVAALRAERDAAVMHREIDTEIIATLRAEVERLRVAMKSLYHGYVRTLEAGRDRIIYYGGDCDPVDVMEAGDPCLIAARAALEAKP